MKSYFSTALGLVFVAMIVAFIVVKRGDNARHDADTTSLVDFSNRLDSAQTRIAICEGKITVLSNSLDEARSATSTFSNRVTETESSLALGTEQVSVLAWQLAQSQSENQALNQNLTELTSQMTNYVTVLTNRLATVQASLAEENKNSALLSNRLRRDVAERLVIERKFNNLSELQAQLEYLKWNPAVELSAESIYAGLNVEVRSNGTFHVTSPN